MPTRTVVLRRAFLGWSVSDSASHALEVVDELLGLLLES